MRPPGKPNTFTSDGVDLSSPTHTCPSDEIRLDRGPSTPTTQIFCENTAPYHRQCQCSQRAKRAPPSTLLSGIAPVGSTRIRNICHRGDSGPGRAQAGLRSSQTRFLCLVARPGKSGSEPENLKMKNSLGMQHNGFLKSPRSHVS